MLNLPSSFGKIYTKRLFNILRHSSSTVFALSSGLGKCGVAVIRVSGPNSGLALAQVTTLIEPPKPRTALLRSIINPQTKEALDRGLVLWFPGPNSFTGEDSFELHVHGGVAVVNAVLSALSSLKNFRLAEPGEFTRRAFHNGKLDLTEVEGLADLLQAETEAQRKQAFLQTHGALSKVYNSWKKSLTNSVAHVEAYIDFEETDTVEIGVLATVTKDVKKLVQEIQQHLSDGRKGETLRNGVKTVILGEPNVGKSSLLNILCRRPAAIVTPISGTTRDIIEVTLNMGGYPLVLADTAGLKAKTEDLVEKEGINRAILSFQNADLVILVVNYQAFVIWRKNDATNKSSNKSFTDFLKYYINSLNLHDLIDDKADIKSLNTMFKKRCIVVLNKTDLNIEDTNIEQTQSAIKISCKTETGIPNLVDSITEHLKILCGDPCKEHPSMNQVRHRQHLTDCVSCLQLFLSEVSRGPEAVDLVISAEHLRKSIRHLGKLVGSVTNEDILDVIFRDFCVGK